MDLQHAFDAVLTIAIAIGGWFVRDLQANQARIMEKLDDLPNIYARRDDVRDMFDQVMTGIEKLGDKLDKKADKN